MRALIVACLFVFVGCATDDPAPAPSPAPAAADPTCVTKCVDSRAMEARSPDDIRRDCEKECASK